MSMREGIKVPLKWSRELTDFVRIDCGVQGAGLICSKLNKDLIISLKLALWLLSTRMGTFLLCGKASLRWKRLEFAKGCSVPVYCVARTFAEIPSKERERILLEVWSHGETEFLRKLFNSLKLFAGFSYFTKVH
jgi:long-chain-alcohol oxidase